MTRRRIVVISIAIIAVGGLLLALRCKCPESGLGFTQERIQLQRLKNRTALPQQADFDAQITAEALLSPGNDTDRWSSSKAARIEVFVLSVAKARPENANCFLRRDTHIHVAMRPNALPSEQLVVEITPRMQDLAAQQGLDWSAATLKETLVGKRVVFEGWLLFDSEHADESENLAPASPNNWRRTAWEIHPVTRIQIIP